ncbi:MAG: quinate 5-dehydrogenase [Anaerolineae bacterium]|nr:quinate 5-dehydrogenase [Anaerolineae bacterium]
MKRAVSISIGSSKRNKAVEIDLLGERVQLERIGTDGDLDRAAALYQELDGQVDAFGVGGTDMGLYVDGRWYTMHSVKRLFSGVRHTPVVDGTGLKTTLEPRVADVLRALNLPDAQKQALVTTAVDRWGMAEAARLAGFRITFGDLIFSLGIPIPLYSPASIKIMAATLIPIVSRLPFHWVYPVGSQQGKRSPRGERYFARASVVLGDCHYIYRYMPEDMRGKIVVTNTTTSDDVQTFRACGVKQLITTTPVLDGRSFGTNMMEAALVAAAGRKQPVDYAHPDGYFQWLDRMVTELGFTPQVQTLND